MGEHPNVGVVRRGYEAMAREDGDALAGVVTAEALPALRTALGPRGGDGAVQSWRVVPLALAAAGDLVVAIDHVCARRGGRPLDTEGVVVFTVADGRIVAVRRLRPRRSGSETDGRRG